MTGHVFHPGHDELHGVTVVVSGASGRTYVGRWHEKGARGITMRDVAIHDPKSTPIAGRRVARPPATIRRGGDRKAPRHSRGRSPRGSSVRRLIDWRILSFPDIPALRFPSHTSGSRPMTTPAIAIDHVTKRFSGAHGREGPVLLGAGWRDLRPPRSERSGEVDHDPHDHGHHRARRGEDFALRVLGRPGETSPSASGSFPRSVGSTGR